MRPLVTLFSSRLFLATTTLVLGMTIGLVGVTALNRSGGTPPSEPAPVAAAAGLATSERGDGIGLVLDQAVEAAQNGQAGDPAKARKADGPGLLRLLVGRTERAEITVTVADGTKTMLYVRAEIATISTSSVTMKLRDGTSQTFAIDAQTFIREKGKKITTADLQVGDRAMVFGLKNADGTYTARLIRCVKEKARPTASPSGS